MSPKAEPGPSLLVTVGELGERLGQALTLIDWRAVVAIVIAPPGLRQQAEEACTQALEGARIAASQVVRWSVLRDETGEEQLRGINQARDTLLRDKRLIWLLAASAADVRFLRKTAPDLTSAIDLFVELRPETENVPDWSSCREQLRALMEERHGVLDFTGLLPAHVEQRKLPLAELYQPLVELRIVQSGSGGDASGLLVLGHPGTGKTTFARHLAWVYSRGEGDPLELGAKVPLLLSLSDYGYEREHDRVRSLVDFLPGWLQAQGIAHAGSLEHHLPEVLLLLDGLDEIRAAPARRSVLVEVSTLLREGRVGGVVVTGRSFLVDELRQDEATLRIASTRPPTQDQIRRFLTKFVELRRGDAAAADDLLRRIEQDDDLGGLAQTPLMLAFMAILDELEGRLPDRRIEIYYRLGEMLVERWTRTRRLGTSTRPNERPTRADAMRVLGPLAWWTVEQGGGAVPEAALSRELERIEGLREEPAEAARRASALLELLRADTALLVPLPDRRWSFVHSSIAEYFAGVEVERDPERWSELLAAPFRAEWREIVLFCAGQLGVIEGRLESLDALVEAVLAKSRRSGRYDAKYPSLLIGLLKESPGSSRRQIDGLVDRLLELVLTMAFSPAAAFQVQNDLVMLLARAHDSVEVSLRLALQRWFRDFPDRIDWEHLMNGCPMGPLSLTELARTDPEQEAGIVALGLSLGPLVTGLCCGWFERYAIDLAPTLALWRDKADWRFRFAEWLVTNDEAARKRPFAEVAHELMIDE